MESSEKQILANSWIEYQKQYQYDKDNDSMFWAYEKLDNACRKKPKLALELIYLIMKTDQSDVVLRNLAAGPLEDLLVNFGEEIIFNVEELAKDDLVLRKLLGGVWKNNISDKTWERILKLRDIE